MSVLHMSVFTLYTDTNSYWFRPLIQPTTLPPIQTTARPGTVYECNSKHVINVLSETGQRGGIFKIVFTLKFHQENKSIQAMFFLSYPPV